MEGSGKSTLLAALVRELGARGLEVVATREPGGTALGDLLRAAFVAPELRVDPLAEAMIVSASRAQHLSELIEPALARGAWVLCDRFADATLAYQGYGRGLDLGLLRELTAVATRGRVPDLTFLLDVSLETSRARVLARATERGGTADRLEREDDGFHARVRAGYLQLANDQPRFVVLDGSRAVAALQREALAALAERFGV